MLYKDVTREEVQAYVNGLKAKGFRITDRHQEILDKNPWEDIMLYQPGEKNDMALRLYFNFRENETMEYYEDEPNPAFEIIERTNDYGDVENVIEYNFKVSLNPIDNEPLNEGSIKALDISASDFTGLDGVRKVSLSDHERMPSMSVVFYRDHQLTKEDFEALHDKMAQTLAAKGAKFSHVFSGKEMTADQLKEAGIHSYMVEKDGKKFLLMPHGDSEAGDFGGGLVFGFTLTDK